MRSVYCGCGQPVAAVFEKGAPISDRVLWKLKGFEVFVEPVSEGQLDVLLRKHQGFCHHH